MKLLANGKLTDEQFVTGGFWGQVHACTAGFENAFFHFVLNVNPPGVFLTRFATTILSALDHGHLLNMLSHENVLILTTLF